MNTEQIIKQAIGIEVKSRNVYHIWTNDTDLYEARRGESLFERFEPIVLHKQKYIDLQED